MHVKARETILGAADVFAHAIVAITDVEGLARGILCQFVKFRKSLANLCIILPTKFAHPFFIFFPRKLFIEKTILFLSLTYTSKTILATDAVVAKCAIGTIFHVLGIITVVAVIHVYRFIAKFTVFAIFAVGAIPRVQNYAPIHAVLVKIPAEEQIAVFIFIGMRAIVGVFGSDVNVV